jgi:hypothetical protein
MAILIGLSAGPSAHRRDEFLQAARLGIEPGTVQLQLDLTPGIALADAIVGDIDRDGDGAFSSAEQRAYADQVMRGIELALDGQPAGLQLANAGFPSTDAMRRGEGIIAIQATAALPPVPAGAHRLTFRNNHHPSGAAYLANALAPENSRISVTGQLRDTEQRAVSIDYLLRPAPQAMPLSPGWVPGGLALAIAASLLLLKPLRSSKSHGLDGRRSRKISRSG